MKIKRRNKRTYFILTSFILIFSNCKKEGPCWSPDTCDEYVVEIFNNTNDQVRLSFSQHVPPNSRYCYAINANKTCRINFYEPSRLEFVRLNSDKNFQDRYTKNICNCIEEIQIRD